MSDVPPPTTEEVPQTDENLQEEDEEAPFKSENRSSLSKLIGKAIGLDITRIALPVTYNEPLSFIQRMAEYVQFSYLLDEACLAEDPAVRALYVAIFLVTCFSSTGRTIKPFNPFLGETYEYVDEEKDLKFVAEQVSHHPPIGSTHCETPNFIYHLTQDVKTKFLGNSLDVTPAGTTHIILKKWDELYTLENIKTVVHNVIIGSMWVDHYGRKTMEVRKNSTGELLPVRADMRFKKCGWFGKGWRDVEGKIMVNDQHYFDISGKWNASLSATATSLGKKVSFKNVANPINLSNGNPQVVWTNTSVLLPKENKFSKYGWSEFTHNLNYIDDEIRKYLPVTDSRLREDRYYLEIGDIKKATKAKHILEDAQRARKRSLDAAGDTYQPRYFNVIETDEGPVFEFKGNYWQEREERRKRNEENGTMASYEDANKFWRITSHKKFSE